MLQQKQPELTPSDRLRQRPQEFSFVLGGPLYQLLARAHLSDDTLRLLRRRMVVFALLCWLPLFVLSTLEGKLLHGSAAIPFLQDIEVHVRFLLAVPCLILAELVVHQRTRSVLQQFLERNLIPESEMARFDAAIAGAVRLRNSVTAELLLIALVYGVGIFVVWRYSAIVGTVTWYATPTEHGSTLSLAGMWYGYISLPIFQFLLVRWYFRLAVWTCFLWRVSRIELSLIPTHPDRLGGLGFLANTSYAFVPLLVAHGLLAAGLMANRIFNAGATLTDFKLEIVLLVVYCLGLVLGPLLVFAPGLARARLNGMREYGTLAERYVREFDTKWLRGDAPAKEPLLGSSDIQSLGDLSNSFEVVRTMRAVPFTRQAAVQLAVATLLPILPLVLTIMPVDELLNRLLGMLV
jgi:hypothetical protein